MTEVETELRSPSQSCSVVRALEMSEMHAGSGDAMRRRSTPREKAGDADLVRLGIVAPRFSRDLRLLQPKLLRVIGAGEWDSIISKHGFVHGISTICFEMLYAPLIFHSHRNYDDESDIRRLSDRTFDSLVANGLSMPWTNELMHRLEILSVYGVRSTDLEQSTNQSTFSALHTVIRSQATRLLFEVRSIRTIRLLRL